MDQIINKTTVKTKCDVKDCKNDADYFLFGKGKTRRFFMCGACLASLTDDFAKSRAPKSPKNAIKKIIDRKAEDNA